MASAPKIRLFLMVVACVSIYKTYAQNETTYDRKRTCMFRSMLGLGCASALAAGVALYTTPQDDRDWYFKHRSVDALGGLLIVPAFCGVLYMLSQKRPVSSPADGNSSDSD